MNLFGEQVNELLYVCFNQDAGCFACGTDSGFRVFNIDPFREAVWRSFSNGGIGIVEMLFRCNLIALVGGGKNPRYPTNKVFIWDDHQSRNIGELTFKTEVKAVKLRRDRIVVVLAQKVFVYRFSDLKMIDQIATAPNPRGLVALCADGSRNVLAVPGQVKGSLRIELYDVTKATLIQAHESELAVFSLNSDASRIASASEKGTLIRVWDCASGEPLHNLRRGVDRAEIYCLAFNPMSTYLACTSDKGTIHIFSLIAEADSSSGGADNSTTAGLGSMSLADGSTVPSGVGIPIPQQSVFASTQPSLSSSAPTASTSLASAAESSSDAVRSGLAFVSSMLPGFVPKYFGDVRSAAQIRGIESRCICAFDSTSSRINVVCADGSLIVYSFDEKQGECQRVSTKRFVKDPGELPDNVVTNSSMPLAAASTEHSSSAK